MITPQVSYIHERGPLPPLNLLAERKMKCPICNKPAWYKIKYSCQNCVTERVLRQAEARFWTNVKKSEGLLDVDWNRK